MKLNEMPQHDSSSYGGHKKLLYVTTDDGRYTPGQSSGWDTEAFATNLAVQTLQQQAEQAYQQWQQGLLSPLPFLMYQARLDEAGLSQISGFWRWRIRRHFKPGRYRRLSVQILQRYSDALAVPLAQLQAYQQSA
ncbi:MAG: hypothetical protein KKE30_01245 [Gammaproteobacteria bacterium]|nr:hypothetical protein [Gammaproteobacteria bacterium]MBU1553592.1 hypothetical protein [Gammaproteobacteria bacterium]MBU2070584.1 hypothetical protein [Gammaproteobacteria bacterium]MBU2181994.1 hypothetical protein [Gammaproteobacteria bacterium]MBU2207090.1 hypothetical protein [Gammaproteobacteria bacterium]